MIRFKQMLKNTPLRPEGATGGGARGIFQNLFENRPYLAHPIFKIGIWLVVKN